MPARDMHHDLVRHLLEEERWTITHDPLRVFWEGKSLFVDLGAERMLAAQRNNERIAVEVKWLITP